MGPPNAPPRQLRSGYRPVGDDSRSAFGNVLAHRNDDYDAPAGTGKTTAHTDTYHGRFAKLVPNEEVVEVVEFETTNPALRGEMTIATTLVDANGGTDVLVVYEGLPPGVPTADNETGTRMALARLAALVEAG